ncbi:MAG: hypothetical protein CVU94_00170 [Firmicutes bacterium HGW-Firmicutes-19]|nr:MAG: hypothetical protein CVU94_00170 [Firmicutes bacterium HGW-Firmicutes-19]
MKKVIVLFGGILLLFGCSFSSSQTLGNTNGNIANFGYRVKVKGGIVFANSRDRLRIYFSKSDTTDVVRITERAGVYLNVLEDWVYFMSLDDDYKMVRVKVDGSKEELVSSNAIYPYGGMLIANGWIYYVNNDDEQRIYKMSPDGSINERFLDVSALRLNAAEQGLVFISIEENNQQLMLSDFKSGELKVLAQDAADLTLVVGDWVYFNSSADASKLYRVKLDGSDLMKVNDLRVFALNENQGRLYFSDLNHNYRLSSAKLDGTDVKVISEDMSSDLLFLDGWLYYLNHSDSGREYRIKGKDKEKVITVPKAPLLSKDEPEVMKVGSTNSNRSNGGFFISIGDSLIFASQNKTMGIYKMDNQETPIMISPDQARNLNVWKDWIYYINETDYSGIYRMKADGSDTQVVLDMSVGNLLIYGNWMYFLNHADNARIYKAKVDGSDLSPVSQSEGLFAFSLQGDWLVFANGQGQTMVKVKIDGSEEQVITAISSTFLTTEDGWIYYGDDNTRVALSKVKLDGTGNQKLITNYASHTHIYQNFIVYYDGVEEAIMKMDVNGENITKLSSKGDFAKLHIVNNKLYFFDNNVFEWFEMDLDGGNARQVGQ